MQHCRRNQGFCLDDKSSGVDDAEIKNLLHSKLDVEKFWPSIRSDDVQILISILAKLLEDTEEEGWGTDQQAELPTKRPAIWLSTQVIQLHPENPWGWERSCQILVRLNAYWHEELNFLVLLADNNLHNPCMWRHRRRVVEKLGSDAVSFELKFTEEILSGDARNKYCWVHRQWVLQEFGGWEDELALCDKLIKDDSYNYFAWNQRSLLVTRSGLRGLEDLRDLEVDYAITAIRDKPENKYIWRYLRDIYKGLSGVHSKLDDLFIYVIESGRNVIEVPRHEDELNMKIKPFKRIYLYALETLLDLMCCGSVCPKFIE